MESNEMNIIHSIAEAEDIAKMMIINEDFDGLYALKDIVHSSTVKGTADDYHNFSVNYSRRGDFETACDIIIRGLQQHPLATDLLADFLQYGVKCERISQCIECYEKLTQIPKNRWTWRSFDFSIDFLKAQYEMASGEMAETLKVDMLRLADEFRVCLPFEEQPFLAKAEIYEMLGMYDESVSTLNEAINTVRVAPKCCLKYCDFMMARGEYNEVISAAKHGVVGSAQDQATINIGYLFFLSALAKDALLHGSENYDDAEAVRDIYTDYRIADALLDVNNLVYRRTIKSRTVILELKSGIPYVINVEVS